MERVLTKLLPTLALASYGLAHAQAPSAPEPPVLPQPVAPDAPPDALPPNPASPAQPPAPSESRPGPAAPQIPPSRAPKERESLLPEYRGAIEPLSPPATLSKRTAAFGVPTRRVRFGEKLLWAPRVLFYPVHLITEYGIRTPMEWITEGLEKHRIPAWYLHLTTWDEGRAKVVPIFSLDLGLSGTYGLGVIWRELFSDMHNFSASAASNFARALDVNATSSWQLHSGVVAHATFNIQRRDDFLFYGQDSPTFEERESRFFRDKRRLTAGVSQLEIGWLLGNFEVEVSDNKFGCSDRQLDICGADNLANTPDDLHELDTDMGATFFRGYNLFRTKATFALDTRDPQPGLGSGSGVRVEGVGRYGRGLTGDSKDIEFFRAGGELSLFWDVVPTYQRVLTARVRAEVTDAIGDKSIPFAELITAAAQNICGGFFMRVSKDTRCSLPPWTIDTRFGPFSTEHSSTRSATPTRRLSTIFPQVLFAPALASA